MPMTLGQFIKEIRLAKKLTQKQVADAAGIDDSMISFTENDKSIRPETLRIICQSGLKVNDHDWQYIRLLWLENQTGEPVFKASATKARENLVINEQSSTTEFVAQVGELVESNIDLIDREGLRHVLVQFLRTPKLLISLKQHYQVYLSFHPDNTSQS